MNPKPFSPLNQCTVPCAMVIHSLQPTRRRLPPRADLDTLTVPAPRMAGGPNNWCPRSEDARTSTLCVGAKVLQHRSRHASAIRTPGDIDTIELNEAFAAQAVARSPRRRRLDPGGSHGFLHEADDASD